MKQFSIFDCCLNSTAVYSTHRFSAVSVLFSTFMCTQYAVHVCSTVAVPFAKELVELGNYSTVQK